MSKENNQAKKPFWKKWWFWAIVVVLLIGGIASVGEDSGDVKNRQMTSRKMVMFLQNIGQH